MTGLNQKLWNYKGHGEAIGFVATEFRYDASKLMNSKDKYTGWHQILLKPLLDITTKLVTW